MEGCSLTISGCALFFVSREHCRSELHSKKCSESGKTWQTLPGEISSSIDPKAVEWAHVLPLKSGTDQPCRWSRWQPGYWDRKGGALRSDDETDIAGISIQF